MVGATRPDEYASRSRFEQALRFSGIALFEFQPDQARDADGVHGEFHWCGAEFGIGGITGAAGLVKLSLAVAVPDRQVLFHVLGLDRSREIERRGEFRVGQADGNVIDLTCDARIEFAADGRLSAVSGVLKDVTERRRTLGGMAHEMNNLLQPVALLGRDMLDRDLVAAEGVSQLEIVLEACRKAGRIVGDVLAISHRARRRGMPINARRLLNECLPLVHASLPKDVSVVLHASDDAPDIFVDRIAFSTVLLSLAVNAAAAMDNRGEVVIALDAARRLQPAHFARLRVIDSGCGMDQATLGRAFEPFFTTRPVGQGPGLGLSVAQALVTEMCGTIAIESAAGAGTTVTVIVPVHEGN